MILCKLLEGAHNYRPISGSFALTTRKLIIIIFYPRYLGSLRIFKKLSGEKEIHAEMAKARQDP